MTSCDHAKMWTTLEDHNCTRKKRRSMSFNDVIVLERKTRIMNQNHRCAPGVTIRSEIIIKRNVDQ